MTQDNFHAMLVCHCKSLKPAAMRLTHNYDEANDLIQETLVKALRNQARFEDGTNFQAWLYTIMRNTFITQYHRQIRHKTFVDTSEDQHHLEASPYRLAYNTGEENLMEATIKEKIETLSLTYSHPFLMYFSGYKYQEIAEMMHIPLGTVKNRIHVARKLLQEQIEREN